MHKIHTYEFSEVSLSLWATVKAVTLTFIYGRGSAILPAQEGKSVSICLVKSESPTNMRGRHENHVRIYTELTLLTLKAHITNNVACFWRLLKYFEASLTNSVEAL